MTSGLSLLSGIQTETIIYTGGWLAWIFLAIAVIVGLIAIVRVIDTIQAKKEDEHPDVMAWDGGRIL